MLIRYHEISDEFNRENAKYIQCEDREDYGELIKMLTKIRYVICQDGIARKVKDAEYMPKTVKSSFSSIEIYLEEL